jgi:glycerol-3-phosphate acyltransferase PlsY
VNIALAALLGAYLVGAVPFGFLLVKVKTGADVRKSGSGNIGATNVLRTSGVLTGIVTLLLDVGKGYFAVWLMDWATGRDLRWMSLAALAVMLGHAFPVFLRFRGGKAVASFFGAWFYLAPLPVAAVLLLFLAVVLYSRYVSLGSIIAAGSLPFGLWMIDHPGSAVLSAALAGSALIVWRHRENLRRVRDGTESMLSFRSRR